MFNGWVGVHKMKYFEKNLSKSFMLGAITHPLDISKVSPCYCTCTHPPTNSYNVEIFHFMNTHPPIQHTESVTMSLYTYPPMNMSKYFILGTHPHTHQTYPKYHPVKICHCTHNHPPTKHTQTVISKSFILGAPTHPPTYQTYPKCHHVTEHVLH